MKTRIPLIAAVLLVAQASFPPKYFGAADVHAATIIVTSTADSGSGSLRSALASAANGDVIDVTGVFGNIGGGLLVTNSVTILGSGPTLVSLSGGNHVLHIGSNTTVVIADFTIQNGWANGAEEGTLSGCAGGGIYNDHATLYVIDCYLSGNLANCTGGAIENDATGTGASATLTILDSTISGNGANDGGGGIENDGGPFGTATLTIANCTVIGNYLSGSTGGGIGNFTRGGGVAVVNIAYSNIISNSGGGGSGISNGAYSGGASGILNVVNSTISGNSADYGGGGILNGADLGGTAVAAITNCTVSGNYAAGGGIEKGGGIENGADPGSTAILTVANCTFSGNRYGGIENDGNGGTAALRIGNTILNAGASGPNLYSNLGTVTSLGYNLSSDNGGGYLTATGDQTNTDPMLGPLQDNGGPTFTHALLPGSPAIDTGDPNFNPPPDFDQRGTPFGRVLLNWSGTYRIDIGAYEASWSDSVGDGIPDSWRAHYFGGDGTTTNSQSCALCDADATGQNNLFKYTAGLDPTNPASVFVLKIASVVGQPTQKNLIYNPIADFRGYTVQFRTNLMSGSWAALGTIGGVTGSGKEVTVTDTNAVETQKFYRIDISLP